MWVENSDAIAHAFEAACWRAIEAGRELGYDPTAWVRMIERHGAQDAAVRLVSAGDIQSGFERLVALGRPDLTVEWAILDPAWRSLFRDRQVRQAAEWRLHQAGVEHPGTPPS